MTKTSIIDVKVSGELRGAVTQLSQLSGQSAAAIAEDALAHYVQWRIPQLLDLELAIEAADRGEIATDDEEAAFFARYGA